MNGYLCRPGFLEAKIEPLRGKHTNVLMQMVHVGVVCQKPDRSGYFSDVVTSKAKIEPLRGKHIDVFMQMVHVGVVCQ